MDRRSWLWRRKSSEKSPGETESSGSLSSHSERFSDDQAYSNHNTQLPEATSKATPSDEDANDSIKTLTEKLAAALLNIRAKEDLVKQHAKVAEEAVSGWEKAESEVLYLKQQLEAVTHKSSSIEDRAIHLDGALKECLRQLRQEREEREQKIQEAIIKKTHEWESSKSELENLLAELQFQLEVAKGEQLLTSIDVDLRSKLKAAEKETSSLKIELFSRVEELELRTIERDLSTQAAETASKQHLDSVKKVAKLEAECRMLQVANHKESPALITKQPNFENVMAPPSLDISLMDDFLEMERLASFPETGKGKIHESTAEPDKSHGGDITLRAELESMSNQTVELEEKLVKIEAEKTELEMALTDHQDQLRTLKDCLEDAEVKLVELQTQLDTANEARAAAEIELEATNFKKEMVESQLEIADRELKTVFSKVCCLEEEIQKEQAVSAESISYCQKLEEEISRLQHEYLQKAEYSHREIKEKQDKELALATYKFAECQKTIASLGQQLKSLATLEDFLIDSKKPMSPEDGTDSTKVACSDSCLPIQNFEALSLISNFSSSPRKDSNGGFVSPRKEMISDSSQTRVGKLFPQSKRRNRNENQ